jgi:hypothetical protein
MREAMEEVGLGRREAMEKAFDTLSAESGGETEKPVVETPKEVSKGGKEEPVVKETKPIEKTEEKPLKPLKKEAKPEITPKVEETPKPSRAPGSWKPSLRDKFGKLDPEMQTEILRREAEIGRALNETTAARKFGQEFYNVVRPFEHLMRASGVTPLQAVDNLVKTAAGLQTGTPVQKAQIAANICAAYGIDLRILDQILAGQQPTKETQGNAELMAAIDQRLKPVQDFIGRVESGQQATNDRVMQETAQEAEAFAADEKNEFFEDLRQDIADILDLAANRNRAMSLKEAYDLACQQHPEIRKIVKEREETAATAERAKNYDRSRRATVSESAGTPGGLGKSGRGANESRRGSIERAWEDLSGR